ncbi:MAG TPA: caspase domain-containing protein [Xanthobacteraceae bacterium]|jgi:uncharacterized caspase-like protein|nr:caspase domain-containing protein [Xanthobacteraceae bacterium]
MDATGPDQAWSRKALRAVIAWALLALLLPASAANAEKRIALVIGNSTYRNTATLPNPVNDSEDIAIALKNVGFTVLLERNLDKHSMEEAVARFARLAQDADAALFFYAGHGMQYRGSNYLVPVDARLEDEFKLTFELTRLDDVLFGLERARGVKILILDACRDNPLANRLIQTASSRDIVPIHGLARIEANRGMVIAYSTQANQVATDGTGRNSPFSAALIKEIDEPGVEIGAMFRRVAADVNGMTGGQQLPELSVSLVGDFYLNTHDTDLQAWTKIRDSADRRPFENFLNQYPNSALLPDARQHLAALERTDKAQLEEAQRLQAERQRVQQERLAKEQAERDRLEQERVAKEQAERERIARELAESNKATAAAQPNAEAATTGDNDNAPPAKTAMLTPPTEPLPSMPADVLSGGDLVVAIKRELKRLGCYSGRVDDNWTSAETKSSVGKFAKYASLPAAPDDPSIELLDALRGKSGRVCPLECGALEVERNGHCVVNRCGRGFVLSSDGVCSRPKSDTNTALAVPDKQPKLIGTEPQISNPTQSCSVIYSRCILGITARGTLERYRSVCINARNSCLRTGVWDTQSSGPHGRLVTGLARR